MWPYSRGDTGAFSRRGDSWGNERETAARADPGEWEMKKTMITKERVVGGKRSGSFKWAVGDFLELPSEGPTMSGVMSCAGKDWSLTIFPDASTVTRNADAFSEDTRWKAQFCAVYLNYESSLV